MQLIESQPDEAQRALTLWQLVDDEPVKSEATDALVLRAGTTAAWLSSMPAQDPVLVPAVSGGPQGGPREGPGEQRDGTDGVLAALVLPWGGEAVAASEFVETTLNGVRLQAGMHLLRHADKIEVGDHMLWVAASSAPREERYDPARHGEDLFCFRLKSRFEPGDALVVCPGAPNRSCGLMYSQRAWDMGLACHACGWDPAAPEWQPERGEWTLKHKTPASERLFELPRTRKTRKHRPGVRKTQVRKSKRIQA